MDLTEAASAIAGELVGESAQFSGVSTDTRTLHGGELFFALKGENFDGHDMCAEALSKGAVACVVSRRSQAQYPQVIVQDTRASLGRLASYWRGKHELKIVAITGSNGKTTVKGMVAAILGGVGQVLATEGNFNNDIGLPRTLFKLGAEHQFAVLEMGANHQGEIAQLASLAEPKVGVVTLCAPAHLEGFGSIEGVAKAKGEMFSALPNDGIAIINADDKFYDYWCDVAGKRQRLSFGIENEHADLRAVDIVSNGIGAGMSFNLQMEGQLTAVQIPHDGVHNVMNALAAAAASLAVGCRLEDVVAGLAVSDIVAGRLNVHQLNPSTRLIDDTYNANPTSLIAAAKVAVGSGDDTWVVLGEMAELGTESAMLHADCGRDLHSLGVKKLFTYGEIAAAASEAFGETGSSFSSKEKLLEKLKEQLGKLENDVPVTILVKGSRAMYMETVVEGLLRDEVNLC